MQVALKGLKKKLDEQKQPDPNQVGMLQLLNTGYNMYAGTVDPVEVKLRRARNKRARAARKINRKKK